MQPVLRLEQPSDYRTVEELTRDAFWNHYTPGADEHYLVHQLRRHPAFVPQLDYVALLDGRIVGSILYARCHIAGEGGNRFEVLTFGPLSVLPDYQGRGIGTALVEHTRKIAAEEGFPAIVILGDPAYYSRFGFRPAKEFGITFGGRYPAAHQVLELCPGALSGVSGAYEENSAYAIDPHGVEEFDRTFPFREKAVTPSQAVFQRISTTFL